MNIASLFTVAGLKAAWAKLMVASVAVKIGVGVAAVASTALVLYGAYKLYKYAIKPKASPAEDEIPEVVKTEEETAEVAQKIGFGQRLKNWLNPSRIITYVDNKVRALRSELRSKVQESKKIMDQTEAKIETIEGKVEKNNTDINQQLTELNANVKKQIADAQTKTDTQLKALNQEITGLKSQLDQTNQGLTTRLGNVETRTTTIEGQVRSFTHLRDATNQLAFAAADFNRRVTPPYLPSASSANEGVPDSASEAGETPVIVPAAARRNSK
jgi:hypothetical protein